MTRAIPCRSSRSVLIASLLGGAGIGAAVMYLCDPQSGQSRRDQAVSAAEDALSSTTEHLANTWQALSDKAQEAGHDVAGTTQNWASKAARAVGEAHGKLSDYASDASGQARSYGRGISKSARGYTKDARREAADWISPTSAGVSAAEVIAGSAGALLLGAGLMYLLDPAQGRRRRAYLRDKAVHAAKQTSQYVDSTSRHLGNRAQGVAAKARNLVDSAKEQVAGEVKSAENA